MTDTNKHGLTRDIPLPVKRSVRQRDGFGCVICGLGIYTYEHIDPEFKDAKEHKTEGITLLCGTCQQKKTGGMLSPETVKAAIESPKCKQRGYANEFFDLRPPIGVSLGRVYFIKPSEILRIGTETVLKVEYDKQDSRVKLSGRFRDSQGKVVLDIKDNEWQGRSDTWDIEQVGPRLTFREKQGKIILVLKAEPPHKILIERVDLDYGDFKFQSDELKGGINIQLGYGSMVAAPSAVMITTGTLFINQPITISGQTQVIAGGKNIPLNPLDFDELLKTGRIVSK